MKAILTILIMFFAFHLCSAQDIIQAQRDQEAKIKKIYNQKKITELEYSKLMKDQNNIKDAIQIAKADGVMTPKEKNAINKKLMHVEKKIIKYQRNSEIYWCRSVGKTDLSGLYLWRQAE